MRRAHLPRPTSTPKEVDGRGPEEADPNVACPACRRRDDGGPPTPGSGVSLKPVGGWEELPRAAAMLCREQGFCACLRARSRVKPWARTPHERNSRNSCSTKRARPLPPPRSETSRRKGSRCSLSRGRYVGWGGRDLNVVQ